MSTPLGLKNNNPGNLRSTAIKWQGETTKQVGVGFETFATIELGYRALLKNLETGIVKGNDTITKLISRYAPPTENNTTSYVNAVAKYTGIPANKKLTADETTLKKLAAAISLHENGVNPVLSQIQAGWDLLKKKQA